MRFRSSFNAADAGDAPAPPKSGELTSPAVTHWRHLIQLREMKERRAQQPKAGVKAWQYNCTDEARVVFLMRAWWQTASTIADPLHSRLI